MAIDAYKNFFEKFNIRDSELIDYAKQNIIFGFNENIEILWRDLINRLLNNGIVYIRKAGKKGDLTKYYLDFIEYCFENKNVKVDSNNNYIPGQIIKKATNGLRKKSKNNSNDNKTVINFQVSHIFGNRTKNPLLFEAPWNIVYMPKIFDPLSGHESNGSLTEMFQKSILDLTIEKFNKHIKEYNDLIANYNVMNKIEDYLQNKVDNSDIKLQLEIKRGLEHNFGIIRLS